jgi:hypothetical protein
VKGVKRPAPKRPPLAIANWRPGAARAELRNVELVTEFLLSTSDLPVEEVAAIVGVGVRTLLRWKRTPARKLDPEQRRRMLVYLSS